MAKKQLEQYKDLLFEKKALGHLALIRKNNVPHVTPVWFDLTEDDFKNNIIKVNSAKGRVKTNNLMVNSKISLSIVDPDDIYRYIGINGTIINIIEGLEAENHIHALAFKYLGFEKYPWLKKTEERIKYIIKIDSVF